MQDTTVLIDGKLYSRDSLMRLPREDKSLPTDVRRLARWLHSNSPAHSGVDREWLGQTGKMDLIEFILTKTGPAAGTWKKPVDSLAAPEPVPASNGTTPVACAATPITASQTAQDASQLLTQAIGLIAAQGRNTVNVEQLEAFKADLLKEVSAMIAAGPAPTRIEILGPGGEVKFPATLAHKQYAELFEYVDARQHCALIGPAGSGKSEVCHQIADALGLPFFVMSMGPETTQSEIKGYYDMKGEYVRTPAREACEHGGLLLMDEFDAGNEGVGTCINGMTSNKVAGFPGGKVKVHKDFICVLAMNTYGNGCDRVYVGRNEQDGATLDRFPTIVWEYDPNLELEIAPNRKWALHVQRVRAAIEDLKIKHIVSPRASIGGGKLLNRGKLTWEQLEESFIWKGLARKEVDKVKAALGGVR